MRLSAEEREELLAELREDLEEESQEKEVDEKSEEQLRKRSEFRLSSSIWVSQAPLDAPSILAFRTTSRAANALVEHDCQSWTSRLENDFPPRRGETVDLLSVYANAHMRYVLFQHLHKCKDQWRKHSGSFWMSWTWLCSRIIRRVSPEMYVVARKSAVANGNFWDVGTRSCPRIAHLPDPCINVPVELHTSVFKSLDKLCQQDWLLVYEQLADELRVRAKIMCLSIAVPSIDNDFDVDEALLYLPLWNCGTSRRRSPPEPSGVRDFTQAEAFLESILTAYYDFEDVGKMLQETGGALDFCIQSERENRARSHVVSIRELVRIAFLCGVILDSMRITKAFVWALYSTIHRAAKGDNYDLLRELADMVVHVASHDDRGPSAVADITGVYAMLLMSLSTVCCEIEGLHNGGDTAVGSPNAS
eukprot:GEMP01012117.1.p1 GENE.GEMP01012117.1~~GEMP01012117.1.p1  ORF type:complete len:419 (+),score=94.41 GEMP01012117.1:165-1421(+)